MSEAAVVPVIETERLILRPWREDDRAAFAAMNGDPEVRRYFPSVMTRDEAGAAFDELLERQKAELCFAAVEAKGGGPIGLAGLMIIGDDIPPGPGVALGWRFDREAWGKGYATEAARAWIGHAFLEMDAGEVIAYTVPDNAASLAVMTRLGMRRDPDGDFEHPHVPPDSPLRPHVLYRLNREDWRP